MHTNTAQLRRLMEASFSETELRNLCFDIGVDLEGISSGNKSDKVRELIAHFVRRGELQFLLDACIQERPNIFSDSTRAQAQVKSNDDARIYARSCVEKLIQQVSSVGGDISTENCLNFLKSVLAMRDESFDLSIKGVIAEMSQYSSIKRNISHDVVFVGLISRGKSALINSIIDDDLLYINVLPVHSKMTIIKYGDPMRIVLKYENGRSVEISLEEFVQFQQGNAKSDNSVFSNVGAIEIDVPYRPFRGGVRFVEFPGLGSYMGSYTEDVIKSVINGAKLVVTVSQIDPGIGGADLEMFHIIHASQLVKEKRLAIVINKVDQLLPDELLGVKAFNDAVIRKFLDLQTAALDEFVYYVSARNYEYYMNNSDPKKIFEGVEDLSRLIERIESMQTPHISLALTAIDDIVKELSIRYQEK